MQVIECVKDGGLEIGIDINDFIASVEPAKNVNFKDHTIQTTIEEIVLVCEGKPVTEVRRAQDNEICLSCSVNIFAQTKDYVQLDGGKEQVLSIVWTILSHPSHVYQRAIHCKRMGLQRFPAS